MHRLYIGLVSFAFAGLAAAQGYRPDWDPSILKGPATGTPNEVLVLGSIHLRTLPATFNADNVQLLNDRLAGWKPQAIAIEALSGMQCDYVRRFPLRYQDTIDSYCKHTAPVGAGGMDVPAATHQAQQLLAHWPAQPSAAERRHLAALFLAAGEPASAVVQWLRLPEAERKADDSLDAPAVKQLQTLAARRDESYLIGARLAARLGLERVHAMDDHTADDVTPDEKAANQAIMKAWDNPATEKRKLMDKALQDKIGTLEGFLALYRAHNAPGMGRLVFDSDFGAAMNEPQGYGRGYVSYWETRNLRMAANIREVMSGRRGMRMLVIVGASHKSYLEAYLQQMHDVRVVDAAPLLR
jgi:hypothetical protein